CDRDPSGHDPTDHKGVDRAQGAPAHRLENRSRMRFCPTKKCHPECSLLDRQGFTCATSRFGSAACSSPLWTGVPNACILILSKSGKAVDLTDQSREWPTAVKRPCFSCEMKDPR